MAKVVDTRNLSVDWNKVTIFGGEYGGFQRMDVRRYPELYRLYELQRGAFWVPEEIPLQKDRVNFPSMPEHHQEAFRQNLLFQTLADSVQSRGIEQILAELCTDPSVEPLFHTWAYFEVIHSVSYSHIVREMFPGSEATKFFDSIEKYPDIVHRFDRELLEYNAAEPDIPELLLRVLALEALKFMVSFLVTYSLNEHNDNAIPGTARIIRLINNDEAIHVSISAHLLRIGQKNPEELAANSSDWWEQRAYEIFEETIEDEMKWYDYLEQWVYDIPRLNREDVLNFIKYRADVALKLSGFSPLFGVEKNDLTRWFQTYSSINMQATALQESEGLAYQVGGLINDL